MIDRALFLSYLLTNIPAFLLNVCSQYNSIATLLLTIVAIIVGILNIFRLISQSKLNKLELKKTQLEIEKICKNETV